MRKSSIFHSLIVTAGLSTLVFLAILASILYLGTMTPMQRLAESEALEIVTQKLDLHLRSKEDSVLSIAASLARDQQIKQALQNNNREMAVSSLSNLTEDFAEITDYRMIRAQVIDKDGVIYARSWDLEFFGEPAPHPMVLVTMQERIASASFSLGNAGVGIIGFAPIIENGELLGVISVTQGVGSVVRALREEGLKWILLLNKDSILERFSGRYPVTLATLPSLNDDYLLAHEQWFDLASAEALMPGIGKKNPDSTATSYLDSKVVFDFPIYDRSNIYIGRSLIVGEKENISSRMDSIRSTTVTLIAATLTIVTLVVALLLYLVRKRVLLPVNSIISVINQTLTSGRFSNRVRIFRNDELGEMTENVNVLLANLERALSESNRVMSELASGNFEQRIEGDYQGDLLQMKQGINAAAIELKEARYKVLQASEAKSRFLANMSHEIRTPINGVIGMLSLLETTQLTEEQAEQVHLASRSAELLLGLINDILDFSKIEAGKMTLEHEPLDLSELLGTIYLLFKNIAEKKGLELTLVFDERISSWIKGDSLRIRQILNNLLSNAIKFTNHGGVSIEVNLSAGERSLVFKVTDTGIGIGEEAQQKLFSSFSQGDSSTSRKYGGSGLGLMISKELIQLMNGELWLESEPDQGSCFYVVVPYHPCEAIEIAPKQLAALPNYSDRRVLLVEDNLVNQKLALKLLEKFHIDASLAVNGEEALKALEEQSFDLILMDCQMPVMDGYQATKIIRRRDILTPIAALTANASAEDKHTCLKCGMNDFLSKPYNIQAMSSLLERWLK